jgi:hypothetical protein
MAIRKKIWIYPDVNPTLGMQLENAVANTISSTSVLDYIRVSGFIAATAANAYIYGTIPVIGSYTIQSGDFLEYDVYWESGPGNIQMGMDLHTSAGTLRDAAGAIDQNGLASHPSTNLSSFAYQQWYRRRIPITTFSNGSSVGAAITNYNVVTEADTAGTYIARFKNIAITDGNGVGVDNLTSFATFF